MRTGSLETASVSGDLHTQEEEDTAKERRLSLAGHVCGCGGKGVEKKASHEHTGQVAAHLCRRKLTSETELAVVSYLRHSCLPRAGLPRYAIRVQTPPEEHLNSKRPCCLQNLRKCNRKTATLCSYPVYATHARRHLPRSSTLPASCSKTDCHRTCT